MLEDDEAVLHKEDVLGRLGEEDPVLCARKYGVQMNGEKHSSSSRPSARCEWRIHTL